MRLHHVPCLFLWTNQMVDMVLQFFMDTAMLFRIMQITFSRLILTDRPTRDEFEPFWNQRGRYDAVIGTRSVRGDGKSRKFVENVSVFSPENDLRSKVSDANAPYRLMKTDLVAKYIGKLPEDFNIPNIMFTTYFVHYKEKVKFIDITFKPRQGGTNSINVKKIVKIGWKAVKDFYKLKKEL